MNLNELKQAINDTYANGWNAAIENATFLLETANDETGRQCLVEAIKKLKISSVATEQG